MDHLSLLFIIGSDVLSVWGQGEEAGKEQLRTLQKTLDASVELCKQAEATWEQRHMDHTAEMVCTWPSAVLPSSAILSRCGCLQTRAGGDPCGGGGGAGERQQQREAVVARRQGQGEPQPSGRGVAGG